MVTIRWYYMFNVISHKSLGKEVLVVEFIGKVDLDDPARVDGASAEALLIDLKSFDDDANDYQAYRHNLQTGQVIPDGTRTEDQLTEFKTRAQGVNLLVSRVVSAMLDESVDSKQLLQALKSEGITLEGYSFFKSFLGGWRLVEGKDHFYPISYLILCLINE